MLHILAEFKLFKLQTSFFVCGKISPAACLWWCYRSGKSKDLRYSFQSFGMFFIIYAMCNLSFFDSGNRCFNVVHNILLGGVYKKNQIFFQVVTIRLFERVTTFYITAVYIQVLENAAFACYIIHILTIKNAK